MGELPDGWVNTKLGEVVEYAKTIKIESSKIEDDEWVLELEDIEKGSSKLLKRLNHSNRKSKSTKNRFKVGDVLYGKLRPYLDKVIIADQDGCCSTEIIPITENNILNGRYLFYSLKRKDFLDYVAEISHGLNMPRLGTKQGQLAPFILAPLNEQIRIANKLDTLLAKVEAAQTRLDKIPTLLKRFRQSVLAAATSGELTAEWRIKMNFNNNETWVKTTLGEATNYGKTTKIEPKNIHENTWVLELEDIEKDSSKILKKLKFLDRKSKSTKNKFKKGDVLYGKLRPYLNKVVIAENDGVCTTEILPLEGKNSLANDFLYYFLMSPQFLDYVEKISHGLNMPRLGTKAGKEAKILVPPIEEQKQIVHRVESLFTLADSVEKQYQQARQRTDKLTQSLLSKAFRGQLVPQDPNDEPAEKLLARIQAEREKLKPKKTRKNAR